MKLRIKQNAFLAKLAAKRLKEKNMAIVLGKTIYLHNVSATDFLQNKKWLHHEATHVKQFQQYGFIRFLFLYVNENIKNGYQKNRFEKEAREKDDDESVLEGLEFIR
jgi:hypothetical protein